LKITLGAYICKGFRRSAPLRLAPVILANIRPGWKWFTVTNALASLQIPLVIITTVKSLRYEPGVSALTFSKCLHL